VGNEISSSHCERNGLGVKRKVIGGRGGGLDNKETNKNTARDREGKIEEELERRFKKGPEQHSSRVE